MIFYIFLIYKRSCLDLRLFRRAGEEEYPP
nr:MAG TPA: hypothetical protein [Caudoviricetes sp.]